MAGRFDHQVNVHKNLYWLSISYYKSLFRKNPGSGHWGLSEGGSSESEQALHAKSKGDVKVAPLLHIDNCTKTWIRLFLIFSGVCCLKRMGQMFAELLLSKGMMSFHLKKQPFFSICSNQVVLELISH